MQNRQNYLRLLKYSLLFIVWNKCKTENLFLKNSSSQPSFYSFHRLCNWKSINSVHLLIITAIWGRQVTDYWPLMKPFFIEIRNFWAFADKCWGINFSVVFLIDLSYKPSNPFYWLSIFIISAKSSAQTFQTVFYDY